MDTFWIQILWMNFYFHVILSEILFQNLIDVNHSWWQAIIETFSPFHHNLIKRIIRSYNFVKSELFSREMMYIFNSFISFHHFLNSNCKSEWCEVVVYCTISVEYKIPLVHIRSPGGWFSVKCEEIVLKLHLINITITITSNFSNFSFHFYQPLYFIEIRI